MKEVEQEAYKRIPLDILIHVSDFCNKNGIRYWLGYGTLLGAIRHQGYIPWDDDIDIVIPRKDYDKFRKIYQSEKYPLIDLLSNKKYNIGVAKIYDTNTCYYYKKHFKREIGLFIDVFVLDNIPSDEKERKKWFWSIKRYKLFNLYKNTKLSEILSSKYSWKVKILAIFSKMLPIPSSWVHNKIVELLSKYDNRECEYVGCPEDMRINKKRELYTFIFPKELFDEIIEVKFENHFFKVPARYDEVLKILYGNYMELPPIEERKGKHDLIAFYK